MYLFRLYPPPNKPVNLDTWELQSEIWQGDKAVVKGDWFPLESRTLNRDTKGLNVGGQLILKNFQPGIFELRLHVREKGKKSGITRLVVFGIE